MATPDLTLELNGKQCEQVAAEVAKRATCDGRVWPIKVQITLTPCQFAGIVQRGVLAVSEAAVAELQDLKINDPKAATRMRELLEDSTVISRWKSWGGAIQERIESLAKEAALRGQTADQQEDRTDG